MTTATYRAIRVYHYGGSDEMKLETLPRPQPHANQVLVRVLSTGVNPIDWKIREGYFKEMMPINFPYTPGADIAGIIEEVGPGVTDFHKGDAVFGQSISGAYAEYAIASTAAIAKKPDKMSFDEAAAIPIGATTAWQGLFDHGHLQAGQTVAITGASGGVGIFAVQFAHARGAHVIATTSTPNVEAVRALGADTVIDYKKTEPESVIKNVDLVFDCVGGQTLEQAYSMVKRGGSLVTIAGAPSAEKAQQYGIHAVAFSAQQSRQALQQFAKMYEDGQLKVIIGKTFPLEQAREASDSSQSGHGMGRIILLIADA